MCGRKSLPGQGLGVGVGVGVRVRDRLGLGLGFGLGFGRKSLPTKKQRKMKSETTRSSTKPWRTCNRRWRGLQPYVMGPATL